MIKVTYFYSACVGFRTAETSVLCDPWFSEGIYDGSWYQYPRLADPLATLGEHDYVYVSHIHPDHYDSAFLKQYLTRYPRAKVIIAPFKTNHLSKKMKIDGVPHEIVDELKIGQTSLKLVPNELNPFDVDSGLVLKRGSDSVVNMNDNLFNQDQVDHILRFLGASPTIVLQGYTGAGPYPQTYYSDEATLKAKAEAKKLQFFERYKKMRDAFNPKITIPFAGKYVLGGKLASLNNYRGIADAVEVAAFDPKAVVLEDGGKASIDTESLRPSAVRTKPYDAAKVAAYVRSLADRPMDYERYFTDFPVEAMPFRRLLPKAYATAIKQSVCQSDYYYCVKTGDEWFVMNARQRSNESHFAKEVSTLAPRSELHVDPRYLFGLLTCVFHWNNAEVGSQYTTTRVPDEYNRAAAAFLNYFHV